MNDDQRAGTSSSSKEAETSIGSVASDLKAAATQKFDQTVTEVRTRADDAKTDVAREVKGVATALQHASEELRVGSAQERTLGKIAGSLSDASDSIRDKDLGEILEMVNRVGREHPVLFLGGAALLGFAVSRYAKASGDPTKTSTTQKSAEKKAQINRFVDEGNPNTQPQHGTT